MCIRDRLKPVLENIEYLKSREIWVEVTTLLIPGLNDSKEEIRAMAEFLKNISAELPWHLSAYYPQYKSSIKATETDKITEAVAIGGTGGHIYPAIAVAKSIRKIMPTSDV